MGAFYSTVGDKDDRGNVLPLARRRYLKAPGHVADTGATRSVCALHRVHDLERHLGTLVHVPVDELEADERQILVANNQTHDVVDAVRLTVCLDTGISSKGILLRNLLFLVPDASYKGSEFLYGEEVFARCGLKSAWSQIKARVDGLDVDMTSSTTVPIDGDTPFTQSLPPEHRASLRAIRAFTLNVRLVEKGGVVEDNVQEQRIRINRARATLIGKAAELRPELGGGTEGEPHSFIPQDTNDDGLGDFGDIPIASSEPSALNVLNRQVDEALERIVYRAIQNEMPNEYVPRLEAILKKFRGAFRVEFLPGDLPVDCPPWVEPVDPNAVPPETLRRMQQPHFRRYADPQKEFMDATTERFVQLNLLMPFAQLADPSKPFAYTPAVCVPKPGHKWRLAWDCTQANLITKPLPLPMESIAELERHFAESRVFAKCDFLHGYWQLALALSSAQLYLLCTHNKTFYSHRVLQGSRNASHAFNAAMRHVFALMIGKGMEHYVDDVLLHHTDTSGLLDRFGEFLERCQEKRFYLAPDKVDAFGKSQVFIGRQVSEGGRVTLNPDHVQGVRDMDRPRTVAELHTFIGVLEWLSSNLPRLAETKAPLQDLLTAELAKQPPKHRTAKHTKTIKLPWDNIYQEAFDACRELVLQAVATWQPLPDEELMLLCDASLHFWSACIFSCPAGDIDKDLLLRRVRPVAFASGAFRGAVLHYTMSEKEALSIVEGCKRFEPTLLRNEGFHVITDHLNLLGLFQKQLASDTSHVLASRLARWSMYLSRYNMFIEHVEGENNLAADYLSRCRLLNDEEAAERSTDARNALAAQRLFAAKFISLRVSNPQLIKPVKTRATADTMDVTPVPQTDLPIARVPRRRRPPTSASAVNPGESQAPASSHMDSEDFVKAVVEAPPSPTPLTAPGATFSIEDARANAMNRPGFSFPTEPQLVSEQQRAIAAHLDSEKPASDVPRDVITWNSPGVPATINGLQVFWHNDDPLIRLVPKRRKRKEGRVDGPDKTPEPTIWVPADATEMHARLMVVAHCGSAGHLGMDETEFQLRTRFSWVGMQDDPVSGVRPFCRRCLHCLPVRAGNKTIPRPYAPTFRPSRPNEMVTFDFLTIFNQTRVAKQLGGKSKRGRPRKTGVQRPRTQVIPEASSLQGDSAVTPHTLVVACKFAHFCRLYATPNTDTVSACDALMDWISIFGPPKWVASDRGTHFVNAVLQELENRLKIDRYDAVVGTSHTNGSIERLNRDVQAILSILLSENRLPFSMYPRLLPVVANAINARSSPTLADSNARKVMMGLDTTMPLDFVVTDTPKIVQLTNLEAACSEPTEGESTQVKVIRQHLDNLVKSLEELHSDVRIHQVVESEKSLQRANRKRGRRLELQVGDYVLQHRVVPDAASKLMMRWTGPHQVKTILSDSLYEIKDIITGAERTVHAERLLLYEDAKLHVDEEIRRQAAHDIYNYAVHRFAGHKYVEDGWRLRTIWMGFEDDDEFNTFESL